MKKPFLLIAGYNYYPNNGTGDWIGTFETYEEADKQVKFKNHVTYGMRSTYEVNGRDVDWYKIVDLRLWTE